MKQTVRIIGGKYRGKKIYFPALDGLRPTSDRVKETLFNWLMHDIRDARCLDAFAGSGALGFEAYSRGAKRIVFVEASPEAYINLKQTASSFHTQQLYVVNEQAENYLQNTKECFDIVFLDPPFIKKDLSLYVDRLAHSPLLEKGGLVYIESNYKLSLNSLYWCERKTKQAGQVIYSLYEKIAS